MPLMRFSPSQLIFGWPLQVYSPKTNFRLQNFSHPEVHFRTSTKDPKLNALNNKMSLLGKDNHLLAAF